MADTVTIPKLPNDGSVWADFPVVGKPGWFECVDSRDNRIKPLIRCNCGHVTGIGLHHVHPDGKVTKSFYHKRGDKSPEDPNGCEWHVHLILADWTGQDIGPDQS